MQHAGRHDRTRPRPWVRRRHPPPLPFVPPAAALVSALEQLAEREARRMKADEMARELRRLERSFQPGFADPRHNSPTVTAAPVQMIRWPETAYDSTSLSIRLRA